MSVLVTLREFGLTLSADSRVLVIGTIGVGKSHIVGRLVEQIETIQAHSIDDYRREHRAWTQAGEERARDEFLRASVERNGIFEFTGGGPLHDEVEQIALSKPFDLIIRVHAPIEVCLERVSSRSDWPPYPNDIMPDSDLIQSISKELDRHGFDLLSSAWQEQPLVHVSGVAE